MCIRDSFTAKDWLAIYQDSGGGGRRKRGKISVSLSVMLDIVFVSGMVLFAVFVDVTKNANESRFDIIMKISLIVLLGVLILREILQLMMSIKRYVTSPENWLEVVLILSVSKILYNGPIDKEAFEENRHLAAVSLLLSWVELVTMICKHPKLNRYNIYVTMFYKVLKDFILFLTWYFTFIIAFAFGFYIILHQDERSSIPPAKDENGFFNGTWISLAKTSTMFVGELEFGDIPFNMNSPYVPVTFLFFLAFIFLIVVVLMNLLNGLAVGEIGEIREEAKVYSYLSQVETISYIESTMLGDPFNFLKNIPIALSWLPSCSIIRQFYKITVVRTVFAKVFGPDILLFYNYFADTRVNVKPNDTTGCCCCAPSWHLRTYCCCLR